MIMASPPVAMSNAPRPDEVMTTLPAHAAYNMYLYSSTILLDCCITRQPMPAAAATRAEHDEHGGGGGGYDSNDGGDGGYDGDGNDGNGRRHDTYDGDADDGGDGADDGGDDGGVLPGSAWLIATLPLQAAAARALQYVLDERTPDDTTTALILYDDLARAQALATWLLGVGSKEQPAGRGVRRVMATKRGALQTSHPFLLSPGAQSLILPNEVVPGRLYLGSAPSNNEQSLFLLQITHVLSLLDRPHLEMPVHPTIAHKLVRIADCQSADIDSALLEALPFIAAALAHPTGRLLIHCEAGVSRSATAVIAALMANVAGLADGLSTVNGSGLPYEDALALVRAQRPGVRPNDRFEACLRRAGWMRAWQARCLAAASGSAASALEPL
jgi:protein-tyrosine phosphatase